MNLTNTIKNKNINVAYPYIRGVVIGDGNICINPENGDYYFQLLVKDKDFADEVYNNLPDGAKIKITYHKLCGIMYNVRYHSKNWVLYFIIFNNKNFIYTNKDNICKFIKGFYDSEGCVDYSSGQVTASGNNIKNLKLIKQLLTILNINSKIRLFYKKGKKVRYRKTSHFITYRKNLYQISIPRIETLKFLCLIGFSIKRKHTLLYNLILNQSRKRIRKYHNQLYQFTPLEVKT